MNKFTFYFGQIPTDVELNAMFAELEAGIERFVQDFGLVGVVAGADVTQHTPNNLTVDVGGSAIVYDQTAQRMSWGSAQVVNCAVDENGAGTAVIGGANEKWLSLFVKFVTTDADPRTDDLGNPVFFQQVAGFEFNVAQGAEAPLTTAARPALRGDEILLADIKLIFGQTVIVNADISATRTQLGYVLTGSPLAIAEKSFKDVLQGLLDAFNLVSAGSLIVPLITDSPISLASGSITAVFTALLAALNDQAALLARAGGNTFTTGPQKVDTNDSTIALLSTTKTGADGSSFWKKVLEFPNSDGTYSRVYSGSPDGAVVGWFAITGNALWDISFGWTQDDDTKDSICTVWRSGYVEHLHQPPTPGFFLNFVTSETQDTIKTSGEVGYVSTPKPRTAVIPITGAEVSAAGYVYSPGTRRYIASGGSDFYARSLSEILPSGAVISKIVVLVDQATTTPMNANLWRRHSFNFTAAAGPTAVLAETQAGPGSTGLQLITMTVSPTVTVDRQTEDLTLDIVSAAAADEIVGIEVTWTDPGPRNF